MNVVFGSHEAVSEKDRGIESGEYEIRFGREERALLDGIGNRTPERSRDGLVGVERRLSDLVEDVGRNDIGLFARIEILE